MKKYKQLLRVLVLVSLAGTGITGSLFAQEVTGTVTDAQSDETLPGVNVIVKGTTTGTSTNVEGDYKITVPTLQDTLIVSFVGYQTQEIPINGRIEVNISLQSQAIFGEELVVVGYGTTAEENLTGSVSAVSSSEISKSSVSEVQNLLQGKAAGLQITQGSGVPGNTQTSIEIRGLGSFGASSNPLVLVDGVEGSLDELNPNNIESVSVLKDAASAAIYGARAANGVILVTTKDGQSNQLEINYRNNVALEQPTHLPNFIYNSVEYMEMYNRAAEHSNFPTRYPESIIESYRQNEGSPQYPNFDWQDYMINNAFKQTHDLSVSGGDDNTTYRASLGYLDQGGIIPAYGYDRYTVQLNLNSKVNETFRFGSKISLMKGDRSTGYAPNVSEAILHIYSQGPLYRPYLPDGSGRYAGKIIPDAPFHNRNPAAIANQGSNEFGEYNISGQAFLDVSIRPNLVWSTKGAADLEQSSHKWYGRGVPIYYYLPNESGEYTQAHSNFPYFEGVEENNDQSILYTLYSTLEFEKDLNENNHIKLLGGTSIESFEFNGLSGTRRDFPSRFINELNAGSSGTQENSGTGYDWALQSFFGRANYNFDDKYLLEANVRYDGSSRIAQDYRWGFFPSASVGWRISEEDFFNDIDWMDNLKLRASYGKLGNQQIGNYPYQQVLNLTNYTFGTTEQQGAYLQRLTDQSLQWEETKMLDVGVDYTMSDGLLSLTADWYRKETEDILFQQPIPGSVGLDPPTVNFGSMLNRGIELQLGHQSRIGELRYEVNAIYSKNINKVTKLLTRDIGDFTISREGDPWSSYYLYEWSGIFQSQEEINNSPTHLFTPQPGDLKIKDQNGDGVINSDDRTLVDGRNSDFNYSFNFDFYWKNFDLSLFFQGVYGRYTYETNWSREPFTQASPPTTDWRNAWTPENKTNSMPALYLGFNSYAPITGYSSTYYLHNASYLRLKNINLGYTLPISLLSQVGIKSFRIYLSGDNLFTVTPYDGIDPERAQGTGDFNASFYPQLRRLTGGIDVTF